MSFEKIFEDINFNFQTNRVLSFGDVACNREEIYGAATKIHDINTWYTEWRKIAEIAEEEGRYMHSMYYYRMAEFMLEDGNPNKDSMYYKCVDMFDKAKPKAIKHEIPYREGYLPCLTIGSNPTNKTVLIHGGYDSLIEEFYIVSEWFAKSGYNVILFEGEGQGGTLRQGMKFNEKWENSVGAILDFFKLDKVALVGISWGGYFALRAAAFDKRIAHVVCYDICYDGLDVMLNLLDDKIKPIFKIIYNLKLKRVINTLVKNKMKKNSLANWGISHGMYITGSNSPYDFYKTIEKHTLKNLLEKIDQNVLLLAGEKDHYIPRWQFEYLKKNLFHANVTSRLFLQNEGGEQHCQVGNYSLALDYILSWLKNSY